MIVNVTYLGRSADFHIDSYTRVSDRDVKRIAVEMIRSGGVPGIYEPALSEHAFDHHVVDRFGRDRVYLRPKVPFGR